MPRSSRRDQIIEKADALFYQRGFAATSFADIAEPLGISRGNFYHHFKTKDDILNAVITRRISDRADMLAAWDAADDPLDRIKSFVRILIRNRAKIMAYGCPVGTLCTELGKLDHPAKPRADAVFDLFTDWLADQFRALGCTDADDLARHLHGRVQGVSTLINAVQDQALLTREVTEIEAWLKQVTAPKPKH